MAAAADLIGKTVLLVGFDPTPTDGDAVAHVCVESLDGTRRVTFEVLASDVGLHVLEEPGPVPP